jgi:hypothetical protein
MHSRHPFSFTKAAPEPDLASASSVDSGKLDGATKGKAPARSLDVCCLDCEMIYTTAGMSLARVSVVDGVGAPVFDELVRLDDGVEPMYVAACQFLPSAMSSYLLFTVTTILGFLASSQMNMPRRL